MDKLVMETQNLTERNIEKILELLPNVATETEDENGKIKTTINFEKLKQELSEAIVDGEECYDFTWVGKKQAIVESNKPIRKTLRPCPEENESVDWETTENLYIEGDNLDVLKLLQESYLNQVKMIYIDPPYNTGKDYVYRDNFTQDKAEYDEESGVFDEEGNKLFLNTESNGRFHSDWCSMLYPRLKLARNLLKKDGIIFISIDDNEVANLRKICDEIFGEDNFIANVIWQKKYTRSNDAKWFSDNHDHILCYARTKNDFQINQIPRNADQLSAYTNPDNHPKGNWKATPLHAKSGTNTSSYTFKNGVTWQPPIGTYRRYNDETMRKMDENNEIWFGVDGKQIPQRKSFLCEVKDGVTPITIWTYDEVGHNHEANNDLKSLNLGGIFSNPKPVRLLKRMLVLSDSSDKEEIILDFFSGSATTAQAVMQLSAEDNKKRKFIMVQLPEPTYEIKDGKEIPLANSKGAYDAGFKNICEIGKERIKRAGKKIKEENPDKEIDTGFRVFKLDSTNMKDVYYTPAEYDQKQLSLLESNIKEDRNDMDLLYGVLLDWGVELSLSHRIEEIDGKRVHIVNNDDLIACFEESITESAVREIAKKQPTRAVFRDGSFVSDDHKINVDEIFKLLAPNTTVKVI